MVYLGIGRKTSIGNIETTDIRPPRHIGKDGVSLYLKNSPSCVPPLYVPIFSHVIQGCEAIFSSQSYWDCTSCCKTDDSDDVAHHDDESFFFSVGSK